MKIRQDYKTQESETIWDNPERLWQSAAWCIVYGIILGLSGIAFAIAIIGG